MYTSVYVCMYACTCMWRSRNASRCSCRGMYVYICVCMDIYVYKMWGGTLIGIYVYMVYVWMYVCMYEELRKILETCVYDFLNIHTYIQDLLLACFNIWNNVRRRTHKGIQLAYIMLTSLENRHVGRVGLHECMHVCVCVCVCVRACSFIYT
jgi:hypothetical protein